MLIFLATTFIKNYSLKLVRMQSRITKLSCLLMFVFCYSSLLLPAQNTVGLLSYDENQTLEGYNLIFPHNQSTVFLLDNCGRIAHQWTDTEDWRPGNSAYLLNNGNLVKCKRDRVPINDPIWAGGGGEVVEVLNWNNQLLHSFVQNDSLYRLHHDIAPMPNGNILMVLWEYHSNEDAIAAGRDTSKLDQNKLWSEVIWEWDPIADSIVWEWRVWDHLIQDYDPDQANFGTVANHPELIDLNYDEHNGHPDWLHINAIDYNPVLDQFILSVPYFNEVWIVDHSTTTEEAATSTGGNAGKGGDLLYRYGNPATYRQGTIEDKSLFFQHDVKWVDPFAVLTDSAFGQISVYNNRIGNNLSKMAIWSTFQPDTRDYLLENNRFGPAEFGRTIVHPDSVNRAASTGLSSAQLLPNGNALLFAGRWGYGYEINPEGAVVWDYIVPLSAGNPVAQGTEMNIGNNITFRMDRYLPDHPAFAGRNLTATEFLELNPNPINCALIVDTENLIPASNQLNVYPNPSFGLLHIETQKWTDDQLELYNLSGQLLQSERFSGIQKTWNISHLEQGMYILKIGNQRQKIMVLR